MNKKVSSESVVKDIRRRTRRKYSSEEKIRIVLEGLRGEESIANLCRREGIPNNLYYRWSKDFLEAGKVYVFTLGRVVVGKGSSFKEKKQSEGFFATKQ